MILDSSGACAHVHAGIHGASQREGLPAAALAGSIISAQALPWPLSPLESSTLYITMGHNGLGPDP